MPKLLPAKLHLSAHNQRGLSLLEVLVSIAVVSMSITALVIISNAAISSVDDSRNQAMADQYVRQSLEAARVNRDQNGWLTFTSTPTPTMAVGDYRVYSLDGTIMTYQRDLTGTDITANPCSLYLHDEDYAISGADGFYQGVVLNRISTSEVKVTANICYAYRGSSSKKISVQTILSNWQ
jgi:prepilin-type N-terminal cleavage/methylation domain-containing protein